MAKKTKLASVDALPMKKNPWFRAYTEMVDDEKLRLLAFEDRWHFVALLCCKGSNLLDSGGSQDLLRRKVALKLGLSTRELEEVARRLCEVGLIDFDTFQPLAWNARQFKSDSSTDRVRNHRNKAKQECNVSPSFQKQPDAVSVTPPETKTEAKTKTEAEKSISSRKRAARSPKNKMPEGFAVSDTVRQWASDKGYQDLDAHFESFVSKAAANGYLYADWDAALQNAIRDDWAKLRQPGRAPDTQTRQRVDL